MLTEFEEQMLVVTVQKLSKRVEQLEQENAFLWVEAHAIRERLTEYAEEQNDRDTDQEEALASLGASPLLCGMGYYSLMQHTS